MIKHAKPKAFYDTFERKGPGQRTTHYCPGCGHGTVHKLIAECLDDFAIADRTVFMSPVGCSVFAYYYFRTGNVQCAHGRAPAVATGVRRCLDDAIVISYQGDGDLAGIGTAEIIHAANRGENMTVFFVNNAIYGMTGGQMAPTTLVGQKTTTTPLGRDRLRDGNPIGMAEIISAIPTPVYVERVSLGTPQDVLKARKAVRKGLKYQMEKKGFSFVEILSPCPINWKMDSTTARAWLVQNLEPAFPVKVFRDQGAEKGENAESLPGGRLPWLDDDQLLKLLQGDAAITETTKSRLPQDQQVKIAGFGGQGVLSAGMFLAKGGIAEGLHATWLPSYGPEMRGGKAYSSVILSRKPIGSPVVDAPNVLVAMNAPSLAAFEGEVQSGGLILVNSSIIDRKVTRDDVKAIYVPASDLASEAGLITAANMVMLTVYLAVTGALQVDTLRKLLPMSVKRKEHVQANLDLVDRSLQYLKEHPPAGETPLATA